MIDNIVYTSVDEQITKLQTQNLIINDVGFAKHALRQYGYSNLVKSYREPYLTINDGEKKYRDGVTFEQLTSLYVFDKSLRNAVISAMLDLEEHIKETAADIVASKFGTKEKEYLKYRNYRAKRTRNPKFTLASILDNMNAALATGKDPIHHYATEHGIVPPWILFKGIYFSTIINFIKFFKIPEQDEMTHRLYGHTFNLADNKARMLMMDTLFIALEYRNLSAHGGRTYNYECNRRLRWNDIFNDKQVRYSGFRQLLFLLGLLEYERPFQILNSALDSAINQHCSNFPEDVTYLGQILNVNIEKHNWVFVTKSSNKFHMDSHCSGIKSPAQIEVDEALKQGYSPCGRCCKDFILPQ